MSNLKKYFELFCLCLVNFFPFSQLPLVMCVCFAFFSSHSVVKTFLPYKIKGVKNMQELKKKSLAEIVTTKRQLASSKTIFCETVHIVWKLLKMSHLNFWILAFSTNFCPIKTDLSGNTVWPQGTRFQKVAKMDHF